MFQKYTHGISYSLILNFRSRSDFGAKTSEKIGKGIKSLKQGVMVKSMEGMVDPLDPAYDLTDLCASA